MALGLKKNRELLRELNVGERAHLDSPPSRGERAFESYYVKPHGNDAPVDQAQLAGSGEGQVDDAAVDVRPAIVHDHFDGLSRLEVGDPDERAERKAAMGGGLPLRVHDLAARRRPAGFLDPVPRREAVFRRRRGPGSDWRPAAGAVGAE